MDQLPASFLAFKLDTYTYLNQKISQFPPSQVTVIPAIFCIAMMDCQYNVLITKRIHRYYANDNISLQFSFT